MSQGQGGGDADGQGIAARLGSAWRGEGREVGARRAKLRGYLSGIRDTYQANYASLGSSFRVGEEFQGGLDKSYPDDVNVSRSGDEEMVLFPSYSRRHVAEKAGEQDPNKGESENSDDPQNVATAIQQHWDRYEDQNAVVDVDVRGWIYTPHKGPLNRKQRLAVGIARQLAGLPAPAAANASPGSSASSSRATSPHPIKQKLEDHNSRKEQKLIDDETEKILHTAEHEAEKAERGEYSEGRYSHLTPPQIKRLKSEEDSIKPLSHADKRASWKIPSEMSEQERSMADQNLMSRLKSFYANPMVNVPVSAFFYNDYDSRQRTIYTNAYGQFALRAALDFVPTHVRVLASENLSAGQEIRISEALGVSVISDIDDTLKHTAMIEGAREAFRNAFLRDLDDMVIDGVRDWFGRLAELGVQFHYVSNSPWQLFPVLSRFFHSVHLPPGSFHLKQYTGMLQGIFEPVAERKKSTMDRIARDFPERRFILIGDSGEADLEVYLDFVKENPGRVLGIFIRDVTTPSNRGYFDQNLRPADSASASKTNLSGKILEDSEQDPELKAAIEASLKDFEAEEARRNGPTRSGSASKPQIAKHNSDDLITFSDSESEKPALPSRRQTTSSTTSLQQPQKLAAGGKPRAPPPPKKPKPDILRGTSTKSQESTSTETQKSYDANPSTSRSSTRGADDKPIDSDSSNTPAKRQPPAPPPPRGSTSSMKQQNISTKPHEDNQGTHSPNITEIAKEKLEDVYESLPSAPWASNDDSRGNVAESSTFNHSNNSSNTSNGSNTNNAYNSERQTQSAAPASTRRLVASYPAAAAQYASSRIGSAINYYYGGNTTGNNNDAGMQMGAATRNTASDNGLTKAQNNRIELWKQRWSKAEAQLRKEGVLLRSWRVGGDAVDDCVRLVERAKKQQEQSQSESRSQQKNSGDKAKS